MVLHLALCHTIILDERTGKYNASSPDELALVNAAKFLGVEFLTRDEENTMTIRMPDSSLRHYRLLNILEFTSSRKRMSVILENPSNPSKFLLLTKGADTVIFPRLKPSDGLAAVTKGYVDKYAEEGLRTLLLARRELDKAEYLAWEE